MNGVTVRGGYPGDLYIGGALLSEGTVTITNSVFSDNSAGRCGAIEQRGNGSLTVRDSRIVRNSVGMFGNILCAGADLPGTTSGTSTLLLIVIDKTSISDNRPQEGYGIEIGRVGSGTISSSTISDNRLVPGVGGGIRVAGAVTIVNSTVANNRGGYGVGVSVAGDGVQITNSTIVNNSHAGVLGPAALHNTIVAGHGSADCEFPGSGGSPVSLGHNLIGNPLHCGPLLSTDLTGDAGLAGFVDTARPGGGVVRLRSDSRAIDAGDSGMCPATDQQGLARPIDGNGDGVRACDIGATEFYPVVNDRVELDAVHATYLPPHTVNTSAAGGEFRITATFANHDTRDICHVAFEVVELQGQAGAPPLLLTRRGTVIGGEGVIVPATLVEAKLDMDAAKHEPYRFRIGLPQVESITFQVNVVGEATAGPCEAR